MIRKGGGDNNKSQQPVNHGHKMQNNNKAELWKTQYTYMYDTDMKLKKQDVPGKEG